MIVLYFWVYFLYKTTRIFIYLKKNNNENGINLGKTLKIRLNVIHIQKKEYYFRNTV